MISFREDESTNIGESLEVTDLGEKEEETHVKEEEYV